MTGTHNALEEQLRSINGSGGCVRWYEIRTFGIFVNDDEYCIESCEEAQLFITYRLAGAPLGASIGSN